jgi:hypothetical protein
MLTRNIIYFRRFGTIKKLFPQMQTISTYNTHVSEVEKEVKKEIKENLSISIISSINSSRYIEAHTLIEKNYDALSKDDFEKYKKSLNNRMTYIASNLFLVALMGHCICVISDGYATFLMLVGSSSIIYDYIKHDNLAEFLNACSINKNINK